MDVNIAFILTSLIIGIGFFSNYFFKKTKIPDIIWLVAFGFIIGPALNLINASALVNYFPLFSAIALLTILFEGGSSINIYKLIRESGGVFLLTTIGFILSASVVGLITYFVFRLNPITSLLLGSIVGGTSSAIVVPTLENLEELKRIKREPSIMLKMESVLTDPIVIIVSLVLIQTLILSPGINTGYVILTKIVSLLSISIVVGFAAGVLWGGVWHKFFKYKYHYMLTIGFVFLIYVLSELVGGSGAIASFMVGLVLGNVGSVRKMLKIKHVLAGLNRETRMFNSYITFFVRTFFFTLMGVMISMSRIELIVYGILISLILLGLRYGAVVISTIGKGLTRNDKITMTLIYPRGLAAAVLASMPFVQYKIPGTDIFSDVVFTVILTTVIISTIGLAIFERESNKAIKNNPKP
ncbi:MAG: cation:proton antiporter [Candidatus Aenigmarchaeota archaeon]|nr:cation:proton antiporter [Candidatus Aenigmarchaeota archaeon]